MFTFFIDAHGLKIQGRGVAKVFAKIPWGVKAFRNNCQEVPLFRFFAFVLTIVLKFA
jgi:hypothetical protein